MKKLVRFEERRGGRGYKGIQVMAASPDSKS